MQCYKSQLSATQLKATSRSSIQESNAEFVKTEEVFRKEFIRKDETLLAWVEPVTDPWLSLYVYGIRRIHLDFFSKLADKNAKIFALLD